jgi:hypothetical protein
MKELKVAIKKEHKYVCAESLIRCYIVSPVLGNSNAVKRSIFWITNSVLVLGQWCDEIYLL